MKISNRIKLIGIICIFLGTCGIAWHISTLSLPQMIEMPDRDISEIPPSLLRWKMILEYLGILVNAIYLIAGILFLMKKQFSLRIMYFALIISIMYEFLPMIFLNQYSALPYFHSYKFDFFTLIGPVFNAVLLVIVYRIGRYYYSPLEEYTEQPKQKMKNINFLIYGYILLILSSAFLDADFLSLLAMPTFLLSVVLILLYYLALISKETPKRGLAISLIISGTILFAASVGFLAVKFMEYLKDISRSMFVEFLSSLLPVIGIYILASLLIFLGIKQTRILNNRRIFLVWLPSLGILPLVMLVIILLKLDQFGI